MTMIELTQLLYVAKIFFRFLSECHSKCIRYGNLFQIFPVIVTLNALQCMLTSTSAKNIPQNAYPQRVRHAQRSPICHFGYVSSSASSRLRFSKQRFVRVGKKDAFTHPSLDLVVEGRPMSCTSLGVDSNEMQQLVRERNPTRRSRVRSVIFSVTTKRSTCCSAAGNPGVQGILMSASVRNVPNLFSAMIRLRRTTTSGPPTGGAVATRAASSGGGSSVRGRSSSSLRCRRRRTIDLRVRTVVLPCVRGAAADTVN